MFAISYDSSKVLRDFSEKHGITYPLLSDGDSRVIRAFGILNTHIPEGHEYYGVPYPGTYMIDAGGVVSDKSFVAEYSTRESVNDMLQESYGSDDLERGSIRVITAPHLRARAFFASPTIRSSQLVVLTVEISLDDGVHVYGQPVSEGYVAVELTVDESEDLVVDRLHYPEPEEMYLEAVGERLPVYTGRLEIKAWCKGVGRGPERPIEARARLRYQACDDIECYLPQTLDLTLPLQFLPHAR